jgi:hypothetical protein
MRDCLLFFLLPTRPELTSKYDAMTSLQNDLISPAEAEEILSLVQCLPAWLGETLAGNTTLEVGNLLLRRTRKLRELQWRLKR